MKLDPLHVCLGAHGDLLIAMPALKQWAEDNGRPAKLLTAKEYLPMMEGVSYVTAAPWDGSFRDLRPCMSMLKTDIPQQPVKILQFFGKGDDKVLPSFWHEQMYLAGLLDGIDRPLVFDRRDYEREAELVAEHVNQKPVVLVCTKGRSSPFKDSELLMEAVEQASLAGFDVVDLGNVKAHRIYDLLGLYDRAAALVSIDTSHLHLSKASSVPVFALARDYPDRWHGTPQQDRFAWYCRYGEFTKRKDEFMRVLMETVFKVQRPKPRLLFGIPKGAYNPSIISHEGEELVSFRHHPDRTWRTQLVLDKLPVKFPFPVSQCAHEDMRLFHCDGKLMATYVCSRGSKTRPKCVTGYGELVRTDDFYAVREHYQPVFGRNDWSGLEKNAVGFDYDGKVHLIWQCHPEHLVLEMLRSTVVTMYRTEAPKWAFGDIRGGSSPVPFGDGKWLRFFHSRIWEKGQPWRYHMGALVMQDHPPFKVLAVSKRPILSGDESGDPMIHHWKQDIVFPLGAVPDGDGWLVSLGINDSQCAVIELNEKDLNL